MKLLDVQHQTAINILKKQPALSTFPCNRIAEAYAVCTVIITDVFLTLVRCFLVSNTCSMIP